MKIVKLLTLCMAFSAFVACGDQPKDSEKAAQDMNEEKTDNNKNEEDAETLVQAAGSDMLEIESSRMAVTMAVSPAVKEFANMMIQEHTMMSQETKALAAKKNYTLPTAMPNDYMDDLEDMKKWEKDDWDNKYIEAQIDQHQKVLNELENRASRTQDADIRAWAQKAMTHVRTHLDKAKMIDDQIDNANK